MTEWEGLIASIGSVGFPIIMCYLMWVFITDTVQKFTESMQENTEMIKKLCDKLDRESRKERREQQKT